jgi:transglutaminase-like putative cysteine protease
VQIAVGYEMLLDLPAPTPMVCMLTAHHSRAQDIIVPDTMTTTPTVPLHGYRDGFGNWCTRLVAPAGRLRIAGAGTVADAGLPDEFGFSARQHPVEELPDEVLMYLLGSRYCETDELAGVAWGLFGQVPYGAARVRAVCDFVHNHLIFDYKTAMPTRTAAQAYYGRIGVCRDYAHLALTFCRCLNIPARYCTGYLSDIGQAATVVPMDFAGWFEAYLDGAWRMFDPRNNTPRQGRVLVATGRDATDVALTTSFGPHELAGFTVWTHEQGQ